METPVEQPTSSLFVALASALASIEAGTIAEAEVESRHIDDGTETMLTVIVRRTIAPRFGSSPEEGST